ncbi:MAG: hypothetical protein ACFB6S_19635 [Geminicoccaceae bacterium]
MSELIIAVDRARQRVEPHARRQWAAFFQYAPHALVVFIACLGVYFFKELDFLVGDQRLTHGALLFLLVVSTVSVRASQVALPLRVVHRTVFLLFAAYAVAAYPAVSDAYIYESAYSELLWLHGRWLAVVAAAIAWFRPGFGIIPVVIVAWKKHLMAEQFGFPLNATDYYPVAELGLYLSFAIALAPAAETLLSRFASKHDLIDRARATSWSVGEAAFLGAFAIHIANYFYSAVAKITLPGAGPLTWVLENQTHYIMMATWVTGLGPLHSHDLLAIAGHEFMAHFQYLTNAMTVAVQLAALVCIIRIRWAMALTGIYDVTHAIIFVTTSILFWKWMTLNVGLIIALHHLLPRKSPPTPLIVMTVAVTILAPIIFNIAALGWFDTAALNRPSVEAVTADGRHVPVPTTYFLEGSAQMAKTVIGRPFEGHFDEIGVFGKALRSYDIMQRANRCELPTAEESGPSRSFAREPKLEKYFVEHHEYILSHVDENGRFPYNIFPHHNWSNPALYQEFRSLDLRTIVAYRYIIDSLCLSYDGAGGVAEQTQLRGVHKIEVR